MIPRRRLNYENITELLKNENPKTPHFYLKHKLHKESILGILFCSSVNCNTSKSSESVDHHLQPIAKKIILRQKHKWLPTKTKKKKKVHQLTNTLYLSIKSHFILKSQTQTLSCENITKEITKTNKSHHNIFSLNSYNE